MSELTTAELARSAVNNGASGEFVACLVTDRDGRHIAREVARRAARDESRPAMGGFTTALWDGDVLGAWRRADAASSDLMRRAGVAPEAEQ